MSVEGRALPGYLTTAEAAERLGISRSVIVKMISRGELKAYFPPPRIYYISEDDLANCLAAVPDPPSSPLSDLRDEHARQLQSWAERNPDRALAASKRRLKRMAELTSDAPRSGEPWTEDEMLALMGERPLLEIALEIGRTYSACVAMRRRRLKMLGLHRPRIKTEQDPYDGSVVSLRPERRNE